MHFCLIILILIKESLALRFKSSLGSNNYHYSLAPQYADPVADLLDKYRVFDARLFRESCVFHKGNYVKVCQYIDELMCVK